MHFWLCFLSDAITQQKGNSFSMAFLLNIPQHSTVIPKLSILNNVIKIYVITWKIIYSKYGINCFRYVFSKAFYLWWTCQIMEVINLISTVDLTGYRYFKMKFIWVNLKIKATIVVQILIPPRPLFRWQPQWRVLLHYEHGKSPQMEIW